MANFFEILKNLFSSMQDVGTIDIMINVLLAGFMSFLIYLVYVRYGTALSNRKHFGDSFLLITICTSLIIALIKTSIALSLGLVGALSIVRFRTAIKEPQELTYLFLCIAMGLGFGANERLLTFSTGLLILLILVIIGLVKKDKIEEVYNISITSRKLKVDNIIAMMGKNCKRVDLRRFDQKDEISNVLLFVEFDSYKELEKSIEILKAADKKIEVSFVAVRSQG